MDRKIIDGNTYTSYDSKEEFEKDLPNIAKISVANMTKIFEKPLTETLKELEENNMIKVKLITYYEDDEKFEEILSLKDFQDRFNCGVKHSELDIVDRIEFIVE